MDDTKQANHTVIEDNNTKCRRVMDRKRCRKCGGCRKQNHHIYITRLGRLEEDWKKERSEARWKEGKRWTTCRRKDVSSLVKFDLQNGKRDNSYRDIKERGTRQ